MNIYKSFIGGLFKVSISLILVGSSTFSYAERRINIDEYKEAIEHIKNLPEAPEGFKWAVIPHLTDEFSGKQLNEKKWHKKSPYWTNGRPPATFKAENVSVKDGNMLIVNTALDEPEGYDGKAGNIYQFAGGAVASKGEKQLYGYFETKMKASETPMSSTFWMMSTPRKVITIDENAKLSAESHAQELDIIETIGKPQTHPEFNQKMNSNTHYRVSRKGEKEKFYSKSTKSPLLDEPSHEDYHTYGVWWVDANTFHMYYDGKHLFTINPSQEQNLQPFSYPMYLHLVTETYDWETLKPSKELLADESKNKTYYDWVRCYQLVPIEKKDNK